MNLADISAYQLEQLETLRLVRAVLSSFSSKKIQALKQECSGYLSFRSQVADFFNQNVKSFCTATCFETHLSACCTKEGIITFFADVVINALYAMKTELDTMERILTHSNSWRACIYLSESGCLWRVKPIVCEMFLCGNAELSLNKDPETSFLWNQYKLQEKTFKWPDRPVLFDQLEKVFIEEGIDSPLMYFHKSPGLLSVKKKTGLTQ